MRWALRCCLILLMLWPAGSTLRAQDVPTRERAEEAFLSLSFGRATGVIPALYWKGQFLLPVKQLMEAAKIDTKYQPDAQRVSGYYVHPERLYSISASEKMARLAERTTPIEAQEMFADSTDLYVVPAVLERAFGWSVTPSLSDLKLNITTRDTLPSDFEALRAAHPAATLSFLAPDAPLRYPRVPRGFDPALARYGLQINSTTREQNVAADIAIAGQIAGGDAQIAMTSANDAGSSWISARWRYAFMEAPVPISSVSAGSLFSAGLTSSNFRGVQITNAPLTPRLRLGDYVLEGKTQPNWDVEVYYEEQLLARTTADPEGNYRFIVPIAYGSAIVSVRQFAPGGAVIVEERRLQVPHALLPARTTEYTVDFGKQDVSGGTLWTGRLAYGFTDAITAFVGHERRNDIFHVRTDAPYAGATVRLPSTYAATFEAAPGVFNRLTVDGLYSSGVAVSLVGVDHAGITAYNPLRLDKTVRGSVFAPLGGRNRAWAVRAGGEWLRYRPGTESVSGELNLTAPIARGQLRAGTLQGMLRSEGKRFVLRNQWTASYTTSLFGRSYGLLQALQGSLFSVSATYDRLSRNFGSVGADLSRPFHTVARVGASVHYDPRTHGTAFSLQYSYTGHLLTGGVTATRADGATQLISNLRGSVGYDRHRGVAEFSAQDWTGKAAATFIAFVDYNGNGVRDRDEPRVNADAIEFRESVAGRLTDDSAFVSIDLLPYHRYSVNIHSERLGNPLLVAPDSAFSFVTDPDVFKLIYIPFVAGGIAEGIVRSDGGTGVGGVTVRVVDEHGKLIATQSTYSDGTFYISSLRPGAYTIAVDPEHLQALRSTAQNTSFTIRATRDGDIVSGITVTLRKIPTDK